MADLFDIANLITTVGVDAVKIKSEPGLPEKSSKEILTELFSTFDVDEGVVSPQNDSDTNIKLGKSEKKKKKKKHKHKDKKHKKKSKHNSSDSSDTESIGTKKKKKHKKKSKRKYENDLNKSSDSDSPKSKIQRLNDEMIIKSEPESLKDKFDILGREDSKSDNTVIKEEPDNEGTTPKSKKEESGEISPTLPPLSKKIDDDNEVPQIPLLLEKSKHSVQGKILIKDLRNSIVYNETVKEIENKEKEKAARMEDGEISDSSEEERTPTLSPSPPLDFKIKSPISSTCLERSKKKSRSPSTRKKIKNDLRLILKEKEKKRKEGKIKDEKDGKSHKNHKNSKSDSKRSHSCQTRDKKRSLSQQRLHRSRSRDRDKRRGRSRERRERRWSHDRWEDERSRDRGHYSRHRSRSKERKERIEIDKKKLLEIARRNAINMIKRGALPLAQRDKAIAAIQAGGKTVDELTDFCKSLSKSEALGELSSISSDDGSGSEKGFHHPFLLKERPNSIIMNIRDAKQLPTKTFQEKTAESSNQLRLQFPVSSGQLHRKTESEWVPVPPKKPEPKKHFIPASEPLCSLPKSIPAPIPPTTPAPVSVPVPAPVPVPIPIPVPVPAPVQQPSVFPQPMPAENMDIGSIVSQRLAAMRKLRENPNDVCALNEMYRAQNEMKSWAESKQMPGQFTGSTGAKVLTPAELTSGYQAWARKDQLTSALPVSGGMGMALLQKMGWRPGEGLGKNKEGTLEPLQLEVKLDKRGLVSDQDIGKKAGKAIKPVVPTIKTLEGKHPVSLLGEYCSKRKLGVPVYELCFECGPDHKKNFLFKVKVNGIEYKPSVASPNKKQAKAEAAQICLQTLGLLIP